MADRKTVVVKIGDRSETVTEGQARVLEANGWKRDTAATKAAEKEAKEAS